MTKPLAGGLWRDNPETPEGKYLIKRRDGSIPQWPYFVLGADDPCAPSALAAYASRARAIGLDPAYCAAVDKLSDEWHERQSVHGASGDPDRGRHRVDDPEIVAEMRKGKSV